jgi:hypothetical protein
MFFMVGMYCRHSPVVRCQKIANTHRAMKAHTMVVCTLWAWAKPSHL